MRNEVGNESGSSDQPFVPGEARQLKAAVQLEPFVDIVEVNLDGAFTNIQAIGDLFVPQAVLNHEHDLDLAWRQKPGDLARSGLMLSNFSKARLTERFSSHCSPACALRIH